jgi:hypothetical protein
MKQTTSWAGLAFVLAFIAGWILNIAGIANAEEITGMVLLRIAGIFVAPLGAVLGYF